MTGNMVALCTGSPAVLPLAGQAEVICTLATNVIIAKVVVKRFRVSKILTAVDPETLVSSSVWRLRKLRIVLR